MTDPSVWVQLRDNGRSLSARYWPIVAGERAGTALPTAARSDTGSTASVTTRPFSTCRRPNRIPNAASRGSAVNDKRRISNPRSVILMRPTQTPTLNHSPGMRTRCVMKIHFFSFSFVDALWCEMLRTYFCHRDPIEIFSLFGSFQGILRVEQSANRFPSLVPV